MYFGINPISSLVDCHDFQVTSYHKLYMFDIQDEAIQPKLCLTILTCTPYELLYVTEYNTCMKKLTVDEKLGIQGVWIIYPGNSEIVVGASARVNRTWMYVTRHNKLCKEHMIF